MKYNCEITSDSIGDTPIIYIDGDLTFDADVTMKKELSEVAENFKMDKLILNFEKTKYINSSGIASLISIIQSSDDRNTKIAFVGMSTHFKKVMDIVGVTDFIEIHNTNEEALESINL